MNFSLKKAFALLVAAAALGFFACKKDGETAPFRLEIVSGGGQTGQQGETLADLVRVRALRPDGSPADGYPIKVVPRGGIATPDNPPNWAADIAPLSTTGHQNIKWTLGCASDQLLDVILFSPKCGSNELVTGLCDTLAVLTVRATAITQTGWVRSCGSNFGGFSRDNVKFRDGLNGEVFMIFNAQIFRSVNDGLEWEQLPQPLPFSSGVVDFAVAPNGDYWALQFFEGVFTSKDRGNSWFNAAPNGGIPFSNASRLVADGQMVFANFDFGAGLYRTIDGGQSWKNILPSGSFYNDFENLVRASNSNLYIIDDYPKLYKSTSEGDTWTQVSVSATNIGSGPVGGLTATEDGKLLFYGQSTTSFYELDLATNTSLRKTFQGKIQFPVRRGGKNFAMVFDQTDGSGTVYEGNGSTYSKTDLRGFDKGPLEAFFVSPAGKLVLVSSTGVYAYLD